MTCEECKKSINRPCASCNSCGNTPKVVQIDNPAEVVMFHKVIIPATMGDESVTPATNGLYKNTLLVYQANGHSFLYSSDGIPTRISFDSGAILFVDDIPEVEQATPNYLYINEDGAAYLTADNKTWIEVSAGGHPDFEMLNNRPKYAGEVMTGETDIPDVDLAKQEAIDHADAIVSAEREAREAADNSLSTSLQQETEARTAADTALGNRLTTAEGDIDALEEGYTELNNKIETEASTRAEQDGILGQSISDEVQARTAAVEELSQAIEESKSGIDEKLDRNVVTDIAIDATASTTVVKLNETKTNLKTGVVSPEEVVFPVADSEQAGIMNSSTFQAVAENSSNIENLMNGVVMTTLLTAEPTQQQILVAWQMASGETTPLNSASVWDNTNLKRYTYFAKQRQWVLTQSGTGGGGVTVSQWTNDSLGIIKGSTNAGQIFAESDGTGSVNGWDSLRSDATVALDKATVNEGTIANKQDKLTAGTGIKIENNVISNTQTSAEWGNITGTLSNQTDLQTELDKKIESRNPTGVDPISPLVSTDMIQDGAVTAAKIADNSITLEKLAIPNLEEEEF